MSADADGNYIAAGNNGSDLDGLHVHMQPRSRNSSHSFDTDARNNLH